MNKKSICNRIYNQRWLLLSFAVPVLFLWCIFALKGIYPFGDYHILVSDARDQYFPFLTQLQHRLQTGQSLFYSWNNGLGSNFWALISYYCLSPLNLLTVLVPSSWLLMVYTVFLSVKMGLIGLTFAIFLKKMFGRNDGTLTLFSTMYTFSAYFMGYYWNTMWLDAIAMLPLISLGTYYLVKEGKFKLFTVSLALGVLFNYFIGIYLCVFTFLSFFYWCVFLNLPWKLMFRRIGRIAVCSVTAIGIAAIFLLPALSCVATSGRASMQLPALLQLNMPLSQFLARFAAATSVTKAQGPSNLYCGMVSLLLASFYLSCKKIPMRQRLCTLVLMVVLALSSWLAVLESFWNGFRKTYDIPGRFTFLLGFVVVTAAYRALPHWKEISPRNFILPVVAGCMVIGACLLECGKKVVLINTLLLLGYLLPVLLATVKKLPVRAAAAVLFLVMTGELFLAIYQPHNGTNYQSYSNYPKHGSQIQTLMDRIDAQEEDFYRMEILPRQTLNDPSLLNYRGASSFWSLFSSDQLNCLYSIGYPASVDTNCSIYLYETSPLVHALFDMEYLLLKDGQKPTGPYMTQFSSCNDVVAYKNTAALSVGFMADATMVQPLSEDDNALVRQNELFRAATGVEQELFTALEHTEKTYEGLQISQTENGRDYYVLTGEENGKAVYSYEMPRSGYLYCYIFCQDIKNFAIQSDGESRAFKVHLLPSVFCAGYFQKGQQICLSWDITGSNNALVACAGIFNEGVFETGMDKLKDEQLQVLEVTEDTLLGTLEVQQPGYFFTSIPYDAGWTLYLNGEETPITPYQNAFVAVENLEPGTYTVQLRYVPQGFVGGLCISIGAVTAFIFMCALDAVVKKRKKIIVGI